MFLVTGLYTIPHNVNVEFLFFFQNFDKLIKNEKLLLVDG